METLVFSKQIWASKESIWNALWEDHNYTEWTKYFGEGSHMKSDWMVGGKTYFLNSEGDGMVATIESLDAPDMVVFQHLGFIKDGEEDTETKEVKEWSGAHERYFLIQEGDSVRLQVELQSLKEYVEHMTQGFEKGLQKIKEMAEDFGS